MRVQELAGFDKLYIYQVEAGDLESGQFLHSTAIQWWEVDDAGLRGCGWPNHLSGWVDAPEKLRDSFYRWPHISFLQREERVGFGECFGPGLVNRKVGRLVEVVGSVEIVETRVVWSAEQQTGHANEVLRIISPLST